MKPEHLLSTEDQLKAENELLKLKLELEHGMKQDDTSTLSAEWENLWLNNIYNFEQQFKNARRVKVYDAIGSPAFRKLATLSADEVSVALKEILSAMEENGVVLDCICTYEDAVIYKFITEELFEVELDDISSDCMITHFTYEEFYPNHDYDLRRYSEEFIKNLLSKKWNPEFDTYLLSDNVSCNGRAYNIEDISAVILAFQEGRTFQLDTFEIEQASFDLDRAEGQVKLLLAYHAHTQDGNHFHHGHCILNFNYHIGCWNIRGIKLPGFG
jgi:hypothetical protein